MRKTDSRTDFFRTSVERHPLVTFMYRALRITQPPELFTPCLKHIDCIAFSGVIVDGIDFQGGDWLLVAITRDNNVRVNWDKTLSVEVNPQAGDDKGAY